MNKDRAYCFLFYEILVILGKKEYRDRL